MISSIAKVLTSRSQECQVTLVLKSTRIRREIHWQIEIEWILPLSSHKEDSMVVLPDHWPLTIETCQILIAPLTYAFLAMTPKILVDAY